MKEHPKASEGYGKMTLRAFVLGIVMVALLAWFTVLRENRPPYETLTATNIPVLPYLVLAAGVLLINPLVKLVRVIRQFSRVELLVIFLMGMVSNGIVSYGLVSQWVPLMAGLSSPRFNHSGMKWDITVQPYMNESFFLAAPGSREAAVKLRDADAAWNRARATLKAAQDLKACREDVARTQEELARFNASGGARPGAESIQQGLERAVRVEQRKLKQAEKAWQEYAATHSPEEVIGTFDAKVKKLEVECKARKDEMTNACLPMVTFVEEFEKGFPEEKRAIPGFVYVPGEGWGSYKSRIGRLVEGRKALRDIEKADAALAAAGPGGAPDAAALDLLLARAIGRLEKVGDTSSLLAQKAAVTTRIDLINARRNAAHVEMTSEQERGWFARDREIAAIEKRVKTMKEEIDVMDKDIKDLTEDIKTSLDPQVKVRERVLVTAAALKALRANIGAAGVTDCVALREQLKAPMAAFNSFDASMRRFLVGDVRWEVWGKPILNWGLIIIVFYIVMAAFNVLIFKQWAHNEKLIYPLAELSLTIAGADEPEQKGTVSQVFKSGLFWTGFAISAGAWCWNYWVRGNPWPFTFLDFKWEGYVDGSVFNALRDTRFKIIFAVVGLTFLIPTRVSCSMWLCQVLGMVQVLIMVWLGMGETYGSFGYDARNLMNFQTAQGGGALIVFALVMLWKCRKYLLSAFAPRALDGLERSERRELRVSSALFLAGSVALVAMFTFRLDVNIFYSITMYLLILVLTIGLLRAVAEGGVLTTQAMFNPFHFIRHVVGMDKSWSSPALFAPMWVFVAMMYLDIKAFIAPAMANALKIRDDMRIRRLKFHSAVAASILVALVVGVAVHIILCSAGGREKMSGHHYNGGVVDSYGYTVIQNMMLDKPGDVAGVKWWLVTGAVTMVVILLLRQRFSWMLHPIGLIMFTNPQMRLFWGSIFIGWCFKALVSKYGNRETYQRLRYVAIGLIAGELVVAALGWHRFDFW